MTSARDPETGEFVGVEQPTIDGFVEWCHQEIRSYRNAKEAWKRADQSIPNTLFSALDVVHWYQRSLTDTPPDRPNPPASRNG